jgi:hypothetical protein
MDVVTGAIAGLIPPGLSTYINDVFLTNYNPARAENDLSAVACRVLCLLALRFCLSGAYHPRLRQLPCVLDFLVIRPLGKNFPDKNRAKFLGVGVPQYLQSESAFCPPRGLGGSGNCCREIESASLDLIPRFREVSSGATFSPSGPGD